MQQRIDGVGQQNRFEETVAEDVGYAVDAVRTILFQRIGNLRPLAAVGRIDIVGDFRREISARIEIDFKVFSRFLGQRHVEQDGFLANLAFEVVPPVILLGIRQIVETDIEIGSQKVLVRTLADVLAHLVALDALLARNRLVVLDFHLLQQIRPLRQAARNVARRAEDARRDCRQHTNGLSVPGYHISVFRVLKKSSYAACSPRHTSSVTNRKPLPQISIRPLLS